MFEIQSPTPLVRLDNNIIHNKNISLFIKRDDLIDPEISGNKWRKLKYNLIEARTQGFKKLLTFGGAFSNHIAATAAASKKFGFESIGIIRGDELNADSNTTLAKAHQDGMSLKFITRSQYQERDNPYWISALQKEHDAYIIPEGGSNELALKGVQEVVNEIDVPFNIICSAVGTGGTVAGLASALHDEQKVIGFAALKGEKYLHDEVSKLLNGEINNYEINHNYHFGGYAKFNPELLDFIQSFNKEFNIPLDPIYTGKMMYGLMDMIATGQFERGTTIVALHTGGLQGIAGFNNQHQTLLAEN
ncbi:MAG: pyridoxal-phosphate dependent enzyme [Reichenbachiella sp.]